MSVKEIFDRVDVTLPNASLSRLEAHFADQEQRDYEWKVLPQEEIGEMLDHMKSIEVYQNIIPLWTDEQSNYIGLYYKGPLSYRICYLNHEETDVSPGFRNVDSFIQELEQQPDADWYELNKDYPAADSTQPTTEELAADLKSRDELLAIIEGVEIDDDQRCQYLYSLMALTPYSHLDTLLRYLDDEDMYVQERACEIFGHYQYTPAVEQLKIVAEHGLPNGKQAAKRALSRMEKH